MNNEKINIELTEVQKEQASATASVIVAAIVRLEREHGVPTVMEMLRQVISAVPDEERRQAILRVVSSQK